MSSLRLFESWPSSDVALWRSCWRWRKPGAAPGLEGRRGPRRLAFL